MTHGVGDIEADVMLVQAERIVEVAADVTDRSIFDREANLRQHRQTLRQKARLDPTRELQLAVDLLIGRLKFLRRATRLGSAGGERVVPLLQAIERLQLRQEVGRVDAARQDEIGARFQAALAQPDGLVLGEVNNRHVTVAESNALLADQRDPGI